MTEEQKKPFLQQNKVARAHQKPRLMCAEMLKVYVLQGMLTHTPSQAASPSLLRVAGPLRRSSSFTPEFTIHTVRTGSPLYIFLWECGEAVPKKWWQDCAISEETPEKVCERPAWVQPQDRRQSAIKALPCADAAEAAPSQNGRSSSGSFR